MPLEPPVYMAIIQLSLPEQGQSMELPVVLSPSDKIEVDEGSPDDDAAATGRRTKKLGECTLGDLQAYADRLESGVWEAYQSIRLIELVADKEVAVRISLQNAGRESAVPLPTWRVVLPERPDVPIAADTNGAERLPDETEQLIANDSVEGSAEGLIGDRAEEEPGNQAEAIGEHQPSSDDGFAVLVSASQSLIEAREPVPGQRPSSTLPETPIIVPSQARVRVAGRRRPPHDETWSAVDVLIDEPALRATQAHALISLNREVAGVLVGPPPEKQPDGRYLVHVADTIVARHTVMLGASVTYTPESWRYLNDSLMERYPDGTAVMVGWYHTHPGFGIFLSGMDQFIHQNFFTQIWHVAYVLDPHARSSGFFGWDRSQSSVRRLEFSWPAWASGSW